MEVPSAKMGELFSEVPAPKVLILPVQILHLIREESLGIFSLWLMLDFYTKHQKTQRRKAKK